MADTYFLRIGQYVEAMQFVPGTFGKSGSINDISKWTKGFMYTSFDHNPSTVLRINDAHNDKKLPIKIGDWVIKDGDIFYTLPDVIFKKRFLKQTDMFSLPRKYSGPVDISLYSELSPDGPMTTLEVAKAFDAISGRGVTWDYSADGEEILIKDSVEHNAKDYPPYLDCPKPIPPRRVK